jgi:hypothetical protein
MAQFSKSILVGFIVSKICHCNSWSHFLEDRPYSIPVVCPSRSDLYSAVESHKTKIVSIGNR